MIWRNRFHWTIVVNQNMHQVLLTSYNHHNNNHKYKLKNIKYDHSPSPFLATMDAIGFKDEQTSTSMVQCPC